MAERTKSLTDDLIEGDYEVAVAPITIAGLLVGAELVGGNRRSERQRIVENVSDTIPVVD